MREDFGSYLLRQDAQRARWHRRWLYFAAACGVLAILMLVW